MPNKFHRPRQYVYNPDLSVRKIMTIIIPSRSCEFFVIKKKKKGERSCEILAA